MSAEPTQPPVLYDPEGHAEHCMQRPDESLRKRPVGHPIKHVPLGTGGTAPPGPTSEQKTRVDGAKGSKITTVNCVGVPPVRVPAVDPKPCVV